MLPETDKKIQEKNIQNIVFGKNFNAFLFLSCIIILVIAVFVFILPAVEKYQLVSTSTLEEKRQILENQKKVVDELLKLNKIYQAISPSLKDKIPSILPNEPELPNLYFNLNQLAEQAGYEIISIESTLPKEEKVTTQRVFQAPNGDVMNSDSTNSKKVLKTFEIDLILQGSGYLALKNFIDLLEHNLRVIDIKSLLYDSSKKNVGFTLESYYYQ